MNHTEYMREYRQRPYAKEREKERKKKRYIEHRAEILEHQRQFYLKDPNRATKTRERAARWRAANPERVREFRRQQVAANPERAKEVGRRSHLKLRYGLTPEQFDEMLAAQGGACAICGLVSDKRLWVDHDHATEAVRGLLCKDCNLLLGNALDDEDRLSRAIAYLRRFRR